MSRRRRAAGPLLVEALVLAAAGEVLGAGVDAGLEVEDDGVVGVADEDRVALDRAELRRSRVSTPSRLSRSARKPTASSLLKSVWRTQRSGLAPRTRQPVAGLRSTVKSSAPSTERGRITIRGVSTTGLAARAACDDLGHREGQLAQPLARGGRDREHVEPALAEVVDDHVGDVAAVGHVDLVERDQPGAVLEAAVPAAARSRSRRGRRPGCGPARWSRCR